MKISVILPSYLGQYDGAASNREAKLKRAIDSFYSQTHPDKELIVIADGCEETKKIYPDATLIDKQPVFSGQVRQHGLQRATGDVICYLDNDDLLSKHHLSAICNHFTGDWVYYDDFVAAGPTLKRFWIRDVKPAWSQIGTSSIAHKAGLNVTWPDGYGHDWQFIQQLIKISKGTKIATDKYIVGHIPKSHVDY